MDTDTVAAARRRLSLADTISVIIGIVIGAGIYETPPFVFQNVAGPWWGLAVWAIGGLLCLVGAFTYAELASTYPRSGGDYVYLSRAYGSWVGFLFGWAQLAVIITGSIGMMAYIFADYSARLFNASPESSFVFAAGAVIVCSVVNLRGVFFGKVAQNVLSLSKVIGLLGVAAAGCWLALDGPAVDGLVGIGANAATAEAAVDPGAATRSFALAMVFVLLTYGGWNDAAFVVAEMRDSRRIVPALLLGTMAIAAIYLLVNAAYLSALGFQAARESKAIAADLLEKSFGTWGGKAMSALVMLSALGAVNGLVFAGSRLYTTLGADHSVFAHLARWHPRWKTPANALVVQAAISLAMIAIVGSSLGQESLNWLFTALGMEDVAWEGRRGFDSLIRCTAPIFWLFFLLTSVSLFVLRYQDPHTPRPFRTPLYPLCPLLFSASCAYMLYSAVDYAGRLGLVGGALLLIGVPLYLLSRRAAVAENVAESSI
jgi:APA family basic amino acid/polyamine antiporter